MPKARIAPVRLDYGSLGWVSALNPQVFRKRRRAFVRFEATGLQMAYRTYDEEGMPFTAVADLRQEIVDYLPQHYGRIVKIDQQRKGRGPDAPHIIIVAVDISRREIAEKLHLRLTGAMMRTIDGIIEARCLVGPGLTNPRPIATSA